MENVVPMSWINQILLLFSILSASLCLIIQEWAGLTPLPVYVSISWAIFTIIVSVWLSCFLFRLSLKANKPVNIEFINKWVHRRLKNSLPWSDSENEKNSTKVSTDSRKAQSSQIEHINNDKAEDKTNSQMDQTQKSGNGAIARRTSPKREKLLNVNKVLHEINVKCIDVWYKNISNEKSFPDEAQELLKKLLAKLFWKVQLIDKIKLTNKIADVLLLHLKEYRRALRRVEKGSAANIEEAYKCLHPGSRSTPSLEHMLHRLVTILAQEFLQWELTSSLPCKLLLSILAKRLLVTVQTVSCPIWIFENLLDLLQSVPKEKPERTEQQLPKQNGIVSVALSDGIMSVTAAVIPRPLPKSQPDPKPPIISITKTDSGIVSSEKPALCLEGLTLEHRGLWNDANISEVDSELDDDRISPVYEEPTDFATTIARLRNLLQQKSAATTPLHAEEKSYAICEGSQFPNLSIPWTEFHTASDGSQQLLYCIQFDDVEQRGVDLFETTIATVRRQYSDFAQLHASLEEVPSVAAVMSDIVLPKGGRIEMETYLKTLCTRLGNDTPPQLRHFLRPSSSAGKKADAVAPRFDRFLAKTVSGVFNTLKTVVPGFEIEQEEEVVPLPTLMPLSDIPWRFVEDIKSRSLALELQQLVAERTDYCSVDTAYEAVDSIDGGDSELLTHWWETVHSCYDDEVDDLDSNLTLTCAVIDLICELLAGINSNNTLQQESVVRWAKLLLGNIIEPITQKLILYVYERLGNTSLAYNAQNNDCKETIALTKEKLLKSLNKKIPYDVKLFFGERDTQKVLQYLLDSCEVKKINLDLSLQILETLASQLLLSCKTNHDLSF